jgi:hypothetical protein
MQLFQLSKEQLKHVGRVVGTIRESKQGSRVLNGLEIKLVNFTLSDKAGEMAAGESHKFEGIDLPVAQDDDGHIDRDKIRKGVEDFVNSTLFFAFNPLRRGGSETEEPEVTLKSNEKDPHQVSLRFEKLDLDHFGVSAAAEAIDGLEQLMFAKWRRVPDEKGMLQKRFSSAAECDRVAHLMLCMGEAIGYTQDDMNKAFSEPPDNRTLVVHKDFLALLAKVEQTLEADFGTRRH